MTNGETHLSLARHLGHSVRITARGDESIILFCLDCHQLVMSAHPSSIRPTREDMQTTVRTLDWLLTIVGEHDRPDLQQPLRLTRAFTQATLAAS